MRRLIGFALAVVLMSSSFVLARSREAFEALLVEHDKAFANAKPDDAAAIVALRERIDAEAQQKGAWQSRLFWYTDFNDALAAAKASGKPILSLRMLGRLDEELSCANSRFFRKMLYVDPAVGQMLRERFVLHWESLRPVPIITIDFGDGRTVKRTMTGNSLHYVFLPDGELLDVMPGLVDADTFRSELASAEDHAVRMRDGAVDRVDLWKTTVVRLATVSPVPTQTTRAAEQAARRTFSKTVGELNTLRATRNPSQNVIRDTYLNQRAIRPHILKWLIVDADQDVSKLTERIYRELFLTPLDDPDMGLNPPDEAALFQ